MSRRKHIATGATLATAGFLVLTGIANSWRLEVIDTRLTRLDAEGHAARVVERWFRSERYVVEERLCGESGPTEPPICSALTTRSFTNLGSHDNLWVFLDAVVNLSDSNLRQVQRRQLSRLQVDLASQLSEYGAWSTVMQADEFPDNLFASDLYAAIVAHAVVCAEMKTEMDCPGGLPSGLSNTLSALAAFVLQVGPIAAPYEMSFRLQAVRSLGDSGLFPNSVEQTAMK